jgi:hypothetical protein
MSRVYIVHGRTGEYEDWRDWPVVAFSTRRRAETWARRANEWCKENGVGWNQYPDYDLRYDESLTNPYDPRMSVDYTGVQYDVQPSSHVPLDPPLPRKDGR